MTGKICYNARVNNAPVAQWIEQRPPEPCAVVRFHSGVPIQKTKQVALSSYLLFILKHKPCKTPFAKLNYAWQVFPYF